MAEYKPETVLITGATGDFGKAFARRFAAIGSKLILHGRNEQKLAELLKEFPDACGIRFDMSDKKAMKAALDALPAGLKDIDLLINNAGLALGLEPAHESSLDDWDTMIDVDIKGLIAMTRYVVEGMTARKRGHIVNIGSTAGSYPYAGGNVYCASKAFVKQFSLSLRADLASKNVRVTNLEPAQVETQFSLVRFKGDADRAAKVYAGTKSLTADDVAESVFWAATLPPHVNVNRLELMPTCQYPAGLALHRDE